MNSSRRYEILLPLRFNDGQPVPPTLLGDTLVELRRRFGAVSWETQIIQIFDKAASVHAGRGVRGECRGAPPRSLDTRHCGLSSGLLFLEGMGIFAAEAVAGCPGGFALVIFPDLVVD